MAKIRVYDLAKELGLESKLLLKYLKDQGEFVRSASSTLEPPVVRRIRQHPPAGPASRDRPATSANNPFKQAADRPRDLVEYRRSDNPFLPPRPARRKKPNTVPSPSSSAKPDLLDTAAALFDKPRSQLKAARSPRRRAGENPPLASDDYEWVSLHWSLHAKDVWTAGPDGLRSCDAQTAADCQQSGILPSDLSIQIAGRSVGHRLTHGEPVSRVAWLLEQQRTSEGTAG